MNLTVKEICDIIGVECGVPDGEVKACHFKNGRFEKDCAYFTIKGESFDGYHFDEAKLKGSVRVIFSDKQYAGLPCVYVADPKEAFLSLAEKLRTRHRGLRSVAVTGSIGKTSMKEMIYSVLHAEGEGLKTRESNNSSLESALMISKLQPTDKYIVTEMGLRRPNQIFVRNSQIVKPNICVITNIGNSHIENFRDKEHILEEKYLITTGMDEKKGLLLVNGDDELLVKAQSPFEKWTFAIENKNADFVGEDIVVENDRVAFTAVYYGRRLPVVLHISGRHNVLNALCAIAVGIRYGIPEKTIQEGLASFRTEGIRQNIIHKDGMASVIADCFTATSESMKVSFAMMQDMKIQEGGKKWAVLGHMMRLGRYSEQMHKEIGQSLKEYDFDRIVTYSGHASYITEEAKKDGLQAEHFYTKEDAIYFLKEQVSAKDLVLFKSVEKFCHFSDLIDGYFNTAYIMPDHKYVGSYRGIRDLHNNAAASIVVDTEGFRVLHGKNIHKKLQAASLSMILSVLVAIEKLKLTDILEVQEKDIADAKGCMTGKLKLGECYTAEALMHACLMNSATDALYTLVRYSYGSAEAFVSRMNERAEEIGAGNSCFIDPAGRPRKGNYTTVFDLALIIKNALENPDYKRIAYAKEYDFVEQNSGNHRILITNNRLLVHEKRVTHLDYYCDGVKGVKVGTNSQAGTCLASVFEKEHTLLIGISLGTKDYEYNRMSYLDMDRMLRWPYE